MSLIDEPLAEGAQPESNHHSVVENLSRDIGLADVVLKVTHQQEIPGRVEAVVQCMVGDMAEHSSGAGSIIAVLVHRDAKLTKLLRVISLDVRRNDQTRHGMEKNQVCGQVLYCFYCSYLSTLPPSRKKGEDRDGRRVFES